MSERAKAPVLVIILSAIIAISLGLGGVVFLAYQDMSAKNTALQEELKSTKEAQKILENKLEENKKAIQGLEAKLKENAAQVESLNKDLQQEKSQRQAAQSQVEQLKTDLQQQQSLRSDLENKFAQAQEQAKRMQEQLSALEGKKAELEVKIKELEQKTQGIELGTIVVGPEAEVTAPVAAPELKAPESAKSAKPEAAKKSAAKKTSEPVGGMEGKILVVNRDYNFAVINLGEKDGVAIGNVFSVYHNNKYLGDATVEKVHDSMSAAGFTSADMRKKVTEGDKVIRKNK